MRNATMKLAVAIMFLALAIYNVKTNEEFFAVSLVGLITPLIAIFISFLLVQHRTDERKAKDNIEKVLDKIEDCISSDRAYVIEKEADAAKCLAQVRRINNKISILARYQEEYGFVKELKFIKNKHQEYEELIGEHFTDIDYLMKSQKELKRPLDLIDDKIDSIRIILYK